ALRLAGLGAARGGSYVLYRSMPARVAECRAASACDVALAEQGSARRCRGGIQRRELRDGGRVISVRAANVPIRALVHRRLEGRIEAHARPERLALHRAARKAKPSGSPKARSAESTQRSRRRVSLLVRVDRRMGGSPRSFRPATKAALDGGHEARHQDRSFSLRRVLRSASCAARNARSRDERADAQSASQFVATASTPATGRPKNERNAVVS